MCWVCDSVAPQCPHCDEARYHDALLSIGLVPSFSTTLPRTGIETNVLQQTQEQKKPDNQEPLQAAPAAVPESHCHLQRGYVPRRCEDLAPFALSDII